MVWSGLPYKQHLLQVDGFTPKRCPVQCLLPHEIVHCLSEHPFVFRSLLAGSLEPSSIESFWRHCQSLDAWCDHPVFKDTTLPLDRTIPLTIHGDGAQFFREDEMFVFSISSLFAPTGIIQDILLYKFPFMIIPERYMRSEAVSLCTKPASVAEHPRSTWVDCECMWMYKYRLLCITILTDNLLSTNKPPIACLLQLVSLVCGQFFIFTPMSYPTMPAHAQVAKAVNKTAADLASWSIQCAMRGTAPDVGFRGEPLNGHRLAMSGKPLAQGWRFLGSYDFLDTIWSFLKCGHSQIIYIYSNTLCIYIYICIFFYSFMYFLYL